MQLAAAVVALAMVVPIRAETIDRVLAVVSGDLILMSDVTAARDLGLVRPDAAAADPIRSMLDRLIERDLKLAEVERYAPPEPPAEAVDRMMGVVRARFASRAAFDAALTRSGVDEKYLRETLRQDLRIQAYEAQRFTVPPPADEDLARFASAHPDAGADAARLFLESRRQGMVDEWVANLRRRGEVIDLYVGASGATSRPGTARSPAD